MTTRTPEERELEEKARVVDQAGRLFGLDLPKKYPEGDAWLYQQIRDFIYARVDLEDERHYDLLASCVLHSYRVRENRTTPYLFVTGPTGTGKNLVLHLMAALCNRGLIAGNPTPAALYRVMDTHHPTLCLDEAEKLAPYKKDQSESTQALLEVCNLGYCQEQPIMRADRDTQALRFYDPYGFKVIASTETLPDTLLGRCVVITTEENIRTDIPVSFDKEEAKELRRYLQWYGTLHDKETPFYKGSEAGLTFDDLKLLIPNYRVVEIFGPLYKATPDPKAQAKILELAQETSEDRREERGSGEDSLILEALLKCREMDPEQDRYPIATIAKIFNEGREKWETSSSDRIGRKLRKFGLKPCRGHGGVRGVLWNEKKLARRFKRYGILQSVPSVKVSPGEDIDLIMTGQGDTRDTNDTSRESDPAYQTLKEGSLTGNYRGTD